MPALAAATTTTTTSILRRQAAKSLYTCRRVRLHNGVSHLTSSSSATTTSPTTTSSTTTNSRRRHSTALSRLPWLVLLRSAVLTTLMCSPTLLRPSIAILGLLARQSSSSSVVPLDPETNPLLRWLIRRVVYDHFCAGTTQDEVAETVRGFKALGYGGVILTFAKEIAPPPSVETITTTTATTTAIASSGRYYNQAHLDMVTSWRDVSLTTLRMLQPGDVLAIKVTGAGPVAVDALRAQQPMPAVVDDAFTVLCDEAQRRGARVWLDAEQQSVQRGIDNWALELMRRWNGPEAGRKDSSSSSGPLVYNTIQAYLKGSREVADRHVAAAAAGGWALGIKLVRGAYMEHEARTLIHDTKAETDACFDDIADSFISKRMPATKAETGTAETSFPLTSLMLATHNAASTERATARRRARLVAALPTCELECAQVAGMADELGGRLIADYESEGGDSGSGDEGNLGAVPRPYKCLTWGSVGECVGYLHRRAMENRGAVERTKHMAAAMREELWRRIGF